MTDMTKNTTPLSTLPTTGTDLPILSDEILTHLRTLTFGTPNTRNNFPTSSKTHGNGTYTTKDGDRTFTTHRTDDGTWTLTYHYGRDDTLTLHTGSRTSEDSLLITRRILTGDLTIRRMDLKETTTDS